MINHGLSESSNPEPWSALCQDEPAAVHGSRSPGADLCIALHRSITTSTRTKDCVRQALAAGIPTFLVEDERAIPRRIDAGDERLA